MGTTYNPLWLAMPVHIEISEPVHKPRINPPGWLAAECNHRPQAQHQPTTPFFDAPAALQLELCTPYAIILIKNKAS